MFKVDSFLWAVFFLIFCSLHQREIHISQFWLVGPYASGGDAYSFSRGLTFALGGGLESDFTWLHASTRSDAVHMWFMGNTFFNQKNFEENRLIHLHNSCHQSKWIIPLSLFAFSRWSQTLWIPCHSATLGAIYEMERQGADTHTPLPFIPGWSFTACRSSPQNLLLGLYYVNLQILTLKIV